MPAWLDDRLILPLLVRRELGFEKDEVLIIKHQSFPCGQHVFRLSVRRGRRFDLRRRGRMGHRLARAAAHADHIIKEQRYPDSLGLLYTAANHASGFAANSGEGKVMGLAA
jgi:carbamoyltransferase